MSTPRMFSLPTSRFSASPPSKGYRTQRKTKAASVPAEPAGRREERREGRYQNEARRERTRAKSEVEGREIGAELRK